MGRKRRRKKLKRYPRTYPGKSPRADKGSGGVERGADVYLDTRGNSIVIGRLEDVEEEETSSGKYVSIEAKIRGYWRDAEI